VTYKEKALSPIGISTVAVAHYVIDFSQATPIVMAAPSAF
jgi:hypothetical protein